jgi:hypothetical protein
MLSIRTAETERAESAYMEHVVMACPTQMKVIFGRVVLGTSLGGNWIAIAVD